MREIRNNQVYVDDCGTDELALKYGTPVMVVSVDEINEIIGLLKGQFLDRHDNVRAAYAGKAFLPLAMCQVIEKAGLCLDVVSQGELMTALKAGFPPERIEFNGNNKSLEEIQTAVENNIGRIILDGADELDLIETACRNENKIADVLIRISPGVDSHTHQFITTGNVDSKFGIPLHGGMLDETFQKVNGSKWVNLLGFHFHIGSQLHDSEPYMKAASVMMDIVAGYHRTHGFVTRELNIGGGFGIRYTDQDDAKPYSYFMDPIMEYIEDRSAKIGIDRPAVVVEPGRSIVANAGATIYTVGAIKTIPGVRKYISVDGGMTDNIRTALYEARYECHLNSSAEDFETVTVCGKCCESGDILVWDTRLPAAKRGDRLIVFGTGAYCHPMASNYNKIPMLPVVFTSKGMDRLVVARQTMDQMLEREVLE